MSEGFVYIIQSKKPKLAKVGFSKNPAARLVELQNEQNIQVTGTSRE